MQEFDLIIIGAGSGNMILGPDHEGWKVAIVEKGEFGGTCLNRGCIPSKMLIYAAEVAETVRTAGKYGIDASIQKVDWARVTGRVWDRIDPLSGGGERWRSSQPNTTVFKGEARFVGEKVLEVNEARIRAPKIVLAAGSRPTVPPVPGLSDAPYHTSDTIMRLPQQPSRLLVLGGGYIGAEMSHFFGSLGTEVTIIDHGPTLIPLEDDETAARFTEVYSKRFNVLVNTAVTRARLEGGEIALDVSVDGQSRRISGDTLLVATGRIPNSDTLNVAATGVEVDGRGQVVSNLSMETSVPGIFALGDITSPYPLKHMANMESRIVGHNLAHPDDMRTVNRGATPHAVFASPQVASAGMSERAVRAAGIPYVVGKQDYGGTAYGWAIEDTESFAKVVGHAESRLILGAHIIGPHASILLQPLINAMRFGKTVDELARETIYVHPALSEVVEQALLNM